MKTSEQPPFSYSLLCLFAGGLGFGHDHAPALLPPNPTLTPIN